LLKICHLPSLFNMASMPAATAGEVAGAKKSEQQLAVAPAKPIAVIQSPEPQLAALTEPVVAYQSQKPSAPVATVAVPVSTAVKQPEPVKTDTAKPKIQLPVPTLGGASVKIPSLKDIGRYSAAEKADEDDPYIKGTDKQDFTFSRFMQLWTEYANQAKADGKATMHGILTAHEPKMLKPYVFEV